MSVSFANKLYEINEESMDETQGNESFVLCQEWQKAKKPIFLMNQTREETGKPTTDGTISVITSNLDSIENNLKEILKLHRFSLIGLFCFDFVYFNLQKFYDKQKKND